MGTPLEMVEEGYSVRLNGRDGPVVTFQGHMNVPSAGALTSFLDAVHERVHTAGAREVAVDLRGLEFLSSTGFRPLVHWLGRIQTLSPAGQYRLRFLFSEERRWQATSLRALACFAPTLVEAEPAARAAAQLH